MQIKKVSPHFSVAEQLQVADLGIAAAQGIKTIVNNRPDNEAQGQPTSAEIAAAAEAMGLGYFYIPITPGIISEQNIEDFATTCASAMGPILAFCRTGTRSITLWAMSEARTLNVDAVLSATSEAGYDLSGMRTMLAEQAAATPEEKTAAAGTPVRHDVVIVGGGTAGLATASSLLKRDPDLDIMVIEPGDAHYYQPGWTLVGGGVFDRKKTQRPMAAVMPKGVSWNRVAVASFEPENNCIVVEDGERIGYRALVVAAGIKLDWDAVEGLTDTLGKNGVTSNYLYDMAPYTWDLVQELRDGRAIFTQPVMPIKCAGAPQKAMYLSCDHWLRHDRLKDISVEFHNAGPVLFGVADYVPPLMKYVEKYDIGLRLGENLVAVDGPAKKAWFDKATDGGETKRVEVDFDMMHVCPKQTAPDFVRSSALANEAGWVDVSPETLQHTRFGNIFSVGDVNSAPNAKTAAAVRVQAPVAAENIVAVLNASTPRSVYDGYGSCPLTVERGKIVLAEFGYGGKHLPSFPQWFINSYEPSRLAWILKEKFLPGIYWHLLLKGREWMVNPEMLPQTPTPHDVSDLNQTS